jgi:Family of unknown function (DUF5335)
MRKLKKEVKNMTIEIPQEKWTEFFDDLSKRRFGWETRAEVLSELIGDQILSDGLSLNGFTYQDKAGKREIEISIGESTEQHQTHNILNPTKVAYLSETDSNSGIVEIEETNGTKTLISLVRSMPIYIGYESYQVVSAA